MKQLLCAVAVSLAAMSMSALAANPPAAAASAAPATPAAAAQPAAKPELTKQQSKMATCNADAGDKKGDERKAFMKSCLSA